MNPLIPGDRKKILIANLRSIADELERGTSELVFTDSHGILTSTGDTDTWMVVVHCRDRKPNPDRSDRIVSALKSAMHEVRRPW